MRTTARSQTADPVVRPRRAAPPRTGKAAPRRGPASACLRWALRHLPEHFSAEPAPFHDELLGDLARGGRLIARVAPRGHAKSTCAALAYPLWRICERLSRNIVIITHEAALATQFVRDIRAELESNDRILRRYGDLCGPAVPPAAADKKPGVAEAKPPAPARRAGAAPRAPRRKWAEGFFTAANGVTVQARGSGGSLRGCRVGPHRPDLVICDDLEKDELVRSAGQRRKLENWLRRVVMPALAPGGQLVVVGSLLHYDSLLANLRDPLRWPNWNYRVYRALEAEADAHGVYRRKALWPGLWPLARLDEERQRIGTLAFEQEYQANPIDDARRVFRPEWLRRYDPGELRPLEARLLNLVAVDPATGKDGGDYFALWAGSLDPQTGVIYTRELTLERIGIVEQVRRIVAAFERWRPARIGIETTAYQVALKDVLEDHSRRNGLYMPLAALTLRGSKAARIEGAAPFFENGLFRLPPVLDAEAESQLLNFPKAAHDDAPDVCAMAIELARELRAARDAEALVQPGAGRFGAPGGW